jgi:hypothetical protein
MPRRLLTTALGLGVAALALAGCFPNGTHPVGTDEPGAIGAGLYRTMGDAYPGVHCQIQRTDSTSTTHTYADVADGPLYIKVEATDESVTSTDCQPWHAALLVPPVVHTSTIGSAFGPGDYLANYELVPGTYTSPGPSSGNCSWERVSDFTHDGTGVIQSNASSTGPQSVTIADSDIGFSSQNCGTWTRTS